MQINSIYIKNFLSFDTLKWPNLDPHLNIIVGPNGAGKTNIIHALCAVKDVLNPNPGQRRSLWSQSAYRGSDQASIEISLDIQFTDAWEKKLLSTFLAATLCNDSVVRDAINTTNTWLLTPISSGGNRPIDYLAEGEYATFHGFLLRTQTSHGSMFHPLNTQSSRVHRERSPEEREARREQLRPRAWRDEDDNTND